MLARKNSFSSGFTLIEVLVVLVIIGITLGFALISFGDFGASRRMKAEIEHFQQLINVVQEQAILESTTYGINIKTNGYAVLRFKPPAQWEIISSHPLFREKSFSEGVIAHLESPTATIKSLIIIHPSGNISPFKITFQSSKNHDTLILLGEYNGTVRLEQQP